MNSVDASKAYHLSLLINVLIISKKKSVHLHKLNKKKRLHFRMILIKYLWKLLIK